MISQAQAAERQDVDASSETAGDETGALYRAVYNACYGLGYGVSLPLLFLGRALPLDNTLGHGLRDGTRAARASSDRTHQRIAQTAESVRAKAGDVYANIAQRVQERVEATQDAIAERRYRRRQA